MRSCVIRLSAVALMAMALGLAQAKPNFTGTWKLNMAISEFGQLPAPDSRTDKITHQDPDLKDSLTQTGPMGEVNAELKYSTDGKETTNTLRGNEIKNTAKWEGDELVIAGKGTFNGADITIDDRWSLSEDGKTLTIQRHFTSPMGDTDQKLVLEKQ